MTVLAQMLDDCVIPKSFQILGINAPHDLRLLGDDFVVPVPNPIPEQSTVPWHPGCKVAFDAPFPVSYTHLTLPTISRV